MQSVMRDQAESLMLWILHFWHHVIRFKKSSHISWTYVNYFNVHQDGWSELSTWLLSNNTKGCYGMGKCNPRDAWHVAIVSGCIIITFCSGMNIIIIHSSVGVSSFKYFTHLWILSAVSCRQNKPELIAKMPDGKAKDLSIKAEKWDWKVSDLHVANILLFIKKTEEWCIHNNSCALSSVRYM